MLCNAVSHAVQENNQGSVPEASANANSILGTSQWSLLLQERVEQRDSAISRSSRLQLPGVGNQPVQAVIAPPNHLATDSALGALS
jgi:hypothetical protein